MTKTRGSEKLLAAWHGRGLTEDSVKEIAGALDKSPATIERAVVLGGANATGMQLSLSYEGDDVPRCGNDISFWLQWLKKHGYGGPPPRPRVIINGIPWPEVVKLELTFGSEASPSEIDATELVTSGLLGR